MRISLALLAIVAPTLAHAQTVPVPSASPPASPTGSPPSWGTRDPLSLPGDNLPPPLSAVLVPPPINPAAPRTPVAAPPLALAIAAAQAALAKCRADGYAVGVAVSNSVGGLVVGMQEDGAFPGRTYNAVRKNLVAIEFAAPSSAVREKLRAGDFATLTRTRPNMTLIGGAIPLFSNGKLNGAIAVSGAPAGDRDEACAAAGAAVFAASR